jgi:hypothetical protein
MSISDLKNMYLSTLKVKIAQEQLRLFCLGKELKNELYIYSYDIIDDIVV